MQETNDLVRRMERLERQNRRLWRLGGAALAATAVVGLASAGAVCKTVWAERFVLKDGSGRERLRIDAYGTESPVLSATDASGRTFAKLTLDPAAPRLELYDPKGRRTGTLGVDEQGDPYADRTGATSVVLAD